MRVRLGKYFRGPGGTFASISTGGGKGKKSGSGCLSVIIFLLIASVALAFFLIAWIPAIIYLIISVKNKDDPMRKKKIIISSIVAVLSFVFLIFTLVLGAMSGINAEWPETEFEVGESIDIPIVTTPDGTTTDNVSICDNDIAFSLWDDDSQTVTVIFQNAGTSELYFIGDSLYETEPVLITVIEPEEPESNNETAISSDSYSEAPEESYSEPEEQPAQDIPDETSANPPKAQEEPVAEQNQVQESEPTGEMVWITSGGDRYHRDSSCSNMKNPREVTIDEAEALGKTPCQKCY